LTYSYDANDNVSAIADSVNPANSQSFGYDFLNRLTGAFASYGYLAWSYDSVGNRLAQSNFGNTTAQYNYAPGSNRLAGITANGTTTPVSYTATGNIISIPPTTGAPVATLMYNAGNRLSSVTGTTMAILGMTYDALGRRVSKSDPSSYPILYTYDQNGHLLEEADGHGLLIDYVDLDGTPVAEITGGNIYYLHADRIGTPQLATDSGQNVAWSTAYQPFGTTKIPTGSITQNLRFPGQYADGEASFSYNLGRDYVPALGRYIEADPIGLIGGTNLYLYAFANPVKLTDRMGLESVTDQNADRVVFGSRYTPPPPLTPAQEEATYCAPGDFCGPGSMAQQACFLTCSYGAMLGDYPADKAKDVTVDMIVNTTVRRCAQRLKGFFSLLDNANKVRECVAQCSWDY
jgi:RHS repeat-associated protein